MTQAKQRRITLIRHAKAEDDGAMQDHLRRLNPRGQKDAAALGHWLGEQRAMPEVFLCSTAQRTRETLAALQTAASVNVPVLLTEHAYLATAEELLSLLQETDDAVTHIGLVAHNPGLHQLAATLAGEYVSRDDEERLMNKFPTATCAQLVLNIGSWGELAPQQGRLESLR